MSEEMYQYLHALLASRANPNSGRECANRMAYVSCMWMLEYAHDENWDALKNYDYDNVLAKQDKALAGQILKQMFSI